jgi:rhomboid protease GluP
MDPALASAAGPETPRQSLAFPLHRPVATWVLLGILIAVFLIETAVGGSTDSDVLVRLGAKVTALIADGEYWRLFTSMFLHIGLMHLAFNGYALVVIGTELESILGWARFLVVYLCSGLFGSLASYALSPHLSAGASGAVFGLIGALAVFFALYRRELGSFGQRRLAQIAFLIVINLFLGFTREGIDNLAHLGGLLSGIALGWALAPRYRVDYANMRVVDRNGAGRYWPAVALALVLLVLGTAWATQIQRDSPRSHLVRGLLAVEQELWDEAASELQLAVARDPALADTSILFHIGLARNHLGQHGAAADAYESALELDPYDPTVHWNLAITYLELERFEEALDRFNTYVELNPAGAVEARPYQDELRSLVP